MEKVIAINSGSSSLKFKLFEMPEEKVLASGLMERIGLGDSIITIKYDGQKYENVQDLNDHEQAVNLLLQLLEELNIIQDFSELTGVGHRVVAGGEYFTKPTLVDDQALAEIDRISDMAPLHNPANSLGIKVFKRLLPQAASVVVVDTAFHQTMPKENYIYSVPYEWYKKYGVRRYGAHGTSHEYVAGEAAKMLGKPLADLKLVTCHLGAGASITAIKDGKSFDTSMGFTPLAGVTMATRSGDVDTSLLSYVMNHSDIKDINEMVDILNHQSGLTGISGVSADMRDIIAAAEEGNERAQLAFDIFIKNVVRYIGQYTAEMGGIDGIVFTAGIGENSQPVRSAIMKRLAYMGITEDEKENATFGKNTFVSTKNSKVKVLRIMTDEELVIARSTYKLAHENK
ncbi:MAG: acetate kinase [Ligilactobacillus sp.]|nr:acetate kinase [Ligilactobacillus sp.]